MAMGASSLVTRRLNHSGDRPSWSATEDVDRSSVLPRLAVVIWAKGNRQVRRAVRTEQVFGNYRQCTANLHVRVRAHLDSIEDTMINVEALAALAGMNQMINEAPMSFERWKERYWPEVDGFKLPGAGAAFDIVL
jgi:hypothetical protein